MMQIPFRVVFEQRGETPRRLSLLVPLASVFAALFFGALFLIATGHSPIDTYSNMFQDGFASFNGIPTRWLCQRCSFAPVSRLRLLFR